VTSKDYRQHRLGWSVVGRAAPTAISSTSTAALSPPRSRSTQRGTGGTHPPATCVRRLPRAANLYWTGANNDDETVRISAGYHRQMYTTPRRLDSDILRRAMNDQSSSLQTVTLSAVNAIHWRRRDASPRRLSALHALTH